MQTFSSSNTISTLWGQLTRQCVKITWPIFFFYDIAAGRSLSESQFRRMCWCSLQIIYQFLNCVDRPRKTGFMIIMYAMKQAFLTKVSASRKCLKAKKNLWQPVSYWWKKAPHQPITKLYGKPHDLVAEEEGEVVGGTAAKEWQQQWRW